jgi:hypothetical protein
VFKLSHSGKEAILHTFNGGSDGGSPFGGLMMDASGSLFGTTQVGGANHRGTLFEIVR